MSTKKQILTIDEKMLLFRDILILRGHIGVIPAEARNWWVVSLYSNQYSAASRLLPWINRPSVMVSIFLRSLYDEGEGVDLSVRSMFLTTMPDVAIPLLDALLFGTKNRALHDPDDMDKVRWNYLETVKSVIERKSPSISKAHEHYLLTRCEDEAKKEEADCDFRESVADLLTGQQYSFFADKEFADIADLCKLTTAVLDAIDALTEIELLNKLLELNYNLAVCTVCQMLIGYKWQTFTGAEAVKIFGAIPRPPINIPDLETNLESPLQLQVRRMVEVPPQLHLETWLEGIVPVLNSLRNLTMEHQTAADLTEANAIAESLSAKHGDILDLI
jgi:hypothetical protein